MGQSSTGVDGLPEGALDEPFYKFHFPCSSDGEESDVSDEEGSDTKKISDNETESENEFESRKSGARKMRKGNLESPHKQGGALTMSFYEVVGR